MENNENKAICAACMGICCKTCGCAISASEFDNINYERLKDRLDLGYTSIYVPLNILKRDPDNIFLALRSRNIKRGVVDLISTPMPCKCLESKCIYEFNERPMGGKLLVPKENGECYYEDDITKVYESWKEYQDYLYELVTYYTGKKVSDVFHDDVVNFFLEVINNTKNPFVLKILDVVNQENYYSLYQKALTINNKNKS